MTEQKRAEEERATLIREQAARAEAEAMVRTRDDFLIVAAHELKTPLTTVLGAVQLAQQHLAPGRDASGPGGGDVCELPLCWMKRCA